MKLTGKSLLLLLLLSPTSESEPDFNAPVLGRTRLMKMAFLFQEEVLEEFCQDRAPENVDLPEFFAWHYGPFSTQLLDDLEFLVNREYIMRSPGHDPIPEELEEYTYWIDDFEEAGVNEYSQECFSLTLDKGVPRAREVWEDLSANQQNMLIGFKSSLVRASLDRILEYVYKKYAKNGFADKSLIREKYLI